MKTIIHCYGNTRSGYIAAIVNGTLEAARLHSKQECEVGSCGVQSFVQRAFEREGSTDIPLPNDLINAAKASSPQAGRFARATRKTPGTIELLLGADRILTVDDFLSNTVKSQLGERPEPEVTRIFQYIDHKAPKWGYDLDDASIHGCLDVVEAKEDKGLPEELIAKQIASGEIAYHAPLGGVYKTGSKEAFEVESRQLALIANALASIIIQKK